MTIRKRLISFIIMMIGFLIVVGGLLYLGRPVIVGAFRQSLDAMNSLSAIRELNFTVGHQKSALNRYLLLDADDELMGYEEAKRSAKEALASLDSSLPIRERYETTLTAAEDVIADYGAGRKARAHERWAAEVFPAYQTLLEEIAALESGTAAEAQRLYRKIRDLSRDVGILLLAVFVLAIGTGILLFRSLYRAVMDPLEALRQGAERFGQGFFDHRISVSGATEFGALAASFNKMAEDVSQLQAQAIHMDRMSAVGQLAGGVAHEINNPLTAVLGQAQILMAKLDEKDPMFASLTKIENAAIRCRKIVRGLLDFSRPSQSRFEPVDINGMVQSTLELCEADLKKGRVSVDRRFASSLPTVRGNASELQQVLLNLINNGIQAMPRGGTLTIETRASDPKTAASDHKTGDKSRASGVASVEIAVKDSGIGISEAYIARVFDPFFTTKDIGKGTGLGLSVSMGIVQKHGGGLKAESAGPNKGAAFIISLPVGGTESAQRKAGETP